MNKIYTAVRETGTFIEEFKTITHAKMAIKEYEKLDKAEGNYEPDYYDIVDEKHCSLISDHSDRKQLLAGELFEMVAFGWTDEDARCNEDTFLERIGNYANGLTKEEIWEVWGNVWEICVDEARIPW